MYLRFYRCPNPQPSQATQQAVRPSVQPTRPVTTSAKATKPVLSLPVAVRSHRDRLRRLLEMQSQLGKESYSSSKMTIRKQCRYVGVVEVDKKKFSSYPADFATEEEAFEEAARLALEELEPKFLGYNSASRYPVTRGASLIAQRTVELLRTKYQAGCWGAAYPGQYEEEYKETLPDDWPVILQQE